MYCRPNIFGGIIELTVNAPQGRWSCKYVVVGWGETGGVVYMLYRYDFHFIKSLVPSLRELIWPIASASCLEDHMPGQIDSKTDNRSQHFSNTTCYEEIACPEKECKVWFAKKLRYLVGANRTRQFCLAKLTLFWKNDQFVHKNLSLSSTELTCSICGLVDSAGQFWQMESALKHENLVLIESIWATSELMKRN